MRETSAQEIIDAGYPSYLDTSVRHDHPPMTPEEFRANWQRQLDVPDREIWAAWAGEEIAAFGAVHRCGRWAAISATVSHRSHLRSYPNHGLFFRMLEHLMAQPVIESVSYGLSSLRSETERDSLHHFKLSVGLEAVPVRRTVVVHPLLRPAVNRVSLAAVRRVARRAPDAHVPAAAAAALELLLGEGGADAGSLAGPGA